LTNQALEEYNVVGLKEKNIGVYFISPVTNLGNFPPAISKDMKLLLLYGK